MKHAPFRHRCEYAGFRAFRRLLLTLPHRASRPIGHALGRAGHACGRSKRRIALDNMRLALPELDERARRAAARGAFRHLGAAVCESVSCSRFDADELRERVPVEGEELLAAARAAGRGLLLVAGHYGYWEISALRLGLALGRLNVVYRPLDNPWVDREVAELRDRFGIALIGKDAAGTRILRALKRGEAVGLLPDQRVRPQYGIEVPFLGAPAWTTTLPAALALRTGVPVHPVACLPAEDGRYRLCVGQRIELPEGPADEEAVAAATRRLLEPLEARIRADPSMWLWMHRRWLDGGR